MKKHVLKNIFTVICSAVLVCALAGCGAPAPDDDSDGYYESSTFLYTEGAVYDESGNYVYNEIVEQGFTSVAEASESYFSLDRNTATYSFVRSQLNSGSYIYPGSVRVEEMINYFDYDFPAPESASVGVSAYLTDCPWNSANKLMLVGVKTAEMQIDATNGNYVFLIDVSGSMSGASRLGLAKTAFKLLVDSLGGGDVVSVVTYASGVNTVLDGAECTDSNKSVIKETIDGLTAYGGTNGSGGIEQAYEVAQSHFIEGGNNRVIIISDGDFNVGLGSTDDLKELIETKAASGVYLSVLGVGMGNTRDDILETLALCGNGNYAYLDNENEAKKVLLDELNGTLINVAKDAKAKVSFSENVSAYRLIGYDNKILTADEYENESTDAGEIGSNLCVAALYEITLADDAEGDLAEIEISYKDALNGGESAKASCAATTSTESSGDLAFISCVAEFGLVLRQSQYKADASLANVLTRLENLTDYIADDLCKQEFVTLVTAAIQSERY